MGIVEGLIAISIIGTVANIQQQQQARKEQKKARNESEAMAAERANAERRQQIREERIRRAQIEQAAANTGTLDSAGALGASSNLSSTLASNLGFNFSQVQHANAISAFNQNASDKMSRSQTYAQLGSLAASSSSLFSGTTTKPDLVGPPSYLKNP